MSDLQRVFDSAPAGLVVLDGQGRCTMCNAAAALVLGRSVDEVLREDVHALLHPDQGTEPDDCPIAAARRGECRSAVIESLKVEYSAAPVIENGAQAGVVISLTDISEWRALEAKLEQTNRVASLGRVAASMAHEFNNVLMGISPFIEVIRRAKDPDKIAPATEHMARAVKRGSRITQEILRFAQPRELVRAAIQVDSWLQNLAAEAHLILPVTCRLEVSTEQPGMQVDGDANQLQQIFINLILNARDAMDGTGTIEIHVRREGRAHFLVRDTGTGIPPENLKHVFEPLFTTKKSGTGLGLAVAYQIVKRHGGEMSVESEAGRGTTFHVFLPLGTSVADAPPAVPALPAEAWRVLLVEDDEAVSSGLMELLALNGLQAGLARTGAEAIEAIRNQHPQLVILDMGLPDIEGRTVYAAIEQIEPDLPVIFATGHVAPGALEMVTRRPNVTYLLKPFDYETLAAAMRKVMTASG